MMGMPMSGFGMTGFDNTRKQYVGTWADTFGTSISYHDRLKEPRRQDHHHVRHDG
jgi:hypothetical protein